MPQGGGSSHTAPRLPLPRGGGGGGGPQGTCPSGRMRRTASQHLGEVRAGSQPQLTESDRSNVFLKRYHKIRLIVTYNDYI